MRLSCEMEKLKLTQKACVYLAIGQSLNESMIEIFTCLHCVKRIDVYQRIIIFDIFVKNKEQISFQIIRKHVLKMTVNPGKKKEKQILRCIFLLAMILYKIVFKIISKISKYLYLITKILKIEC